MTTDLPTANRTRTASIAIATLAALSIAAIAVAIIALQNSSHDLHRIQRLEAQVRVLAAASGGATASVGSRVKSVEGKLTALEAQTTANAGKQSKAEGTLHQLTSCVPELQSELGGLELARGGETVYIKNATNISRECTNTLYGTPGG